LPGDEFVECDDVSMIRLEKEGSAHRIPILLRRSPKIAARSG
jgi:hypothetical protein